jgi:hypothetical protein
MSSLKRMGMVLAVVVAVGVPQTASAFSFSDWLNHFFGKLKERENRDYDWPKYDWPKPRTNPDSAVPEPTAALLFGVGTLVVAARTRKRR